MALLTCAALLLTTQAPAGIVDVPFSVGEDAIIVDATINGRKASLMFDTGFSGAVVLDENINIGPATGVMNLRDFVGVFQAKTVKIKSLKLGQKDIDSTEMEAVQQPAANYSFSYNTHCDGIMGFEVIAHNITEINFEKKMFRFYPKSYDITKLVPDNKKTFLAKLLPTGHNSLEMSVAAANGGKMTLALDTGNAFFATTHKDVLERIGLWKTGQDAKFLKSAFVASGEVASWYARFKDMSIYGIPVPDCTWSIIDAASSSAEGDGTIGYGFLSNFNIIIDYERRRVWFDNWTGKTGNLPKAELGISAAPEASGRRMFVYRVSNGGPAEKAGIRRGDFLLSIDGHDVEGMDQRKLWKLMEGEEGSKVPIVLSRNGQLIRMELSRAYLVNDLRG
ncbi:MAG: PDZ domain-containing protein [Fimbriimonadaceae bacterium]|nr:PDZ domain-containing protein [Fimbriimonadaceae bacterium]